MVLEGVVTNVAAFGAFVDLGVHQDGLVHISAMANAYVKELMFGSGRLRGSSDSPLEEAGIEPLVPSQEGTGSPVARVDIGLSACPANCEKAVVLAVRIRFPPAASQRTIGSAVGKMPPRSPPLPCRKCP